MRRDNRSKPQARGYASDQFSEFSSPRKHASSTINWRSRRSNNVYRVRARTYARCMGYATAITLVGKHYPLPILRVDSQDQVFQLLSDLCTVHRRPQICGLRYTTGVAHQEWCRLLHRQGDPGGATSSTQPLPHPQRHRIRLRHDLCTVHRRPQICG